MKSSYDKALSAFLNDWSTTVVVTKPSEFLLLTSLTVSRESRRDERIIRYLDIKPPKFSPRFEIYIIRI